MAHLPTTGYHSTKRWYDHIEDLNQSLSLMKDLPVDVQLLVANHLNTVINQHLRKTRGGLTDIRNIGITKILGLYNASNRRRWYDRKPAVRRALTMMVTLSEETLQEFATRLSHIGNYMVGHKRLWSPAPQHHSLVKAVDRLLTEPLDMVTTDGSVKLVANGGNPPKNLPNKTSTAQKPPQFKQNPSGPGWEEPR
ncbi:MAG: hypothetical protein SFZ03_01570 [Candidatus Melainabacteria bacterium]|nr:hypothetical protein [Candidatus Melainabacteria bacterium]